VFSKRRSLYGVNFARDAVRKGEALVIVEGQMVRSPCIRQGSAVRWPHWAPR
jgi:hypothetical protein